MGRRLKWASPAASFPYTAEISESTAFLGAKSSAFFTRENVSFFSCKEKGCVDVSVEFIRRFNGIFQTF